METRFGKGRTLFVVLVLVVSVIAVVIGTVEGFGGDEVEGDESEVEEENGRGTAE